MSSKTKEDLIKELKELEDLETKVKSKKDAIKYEKLQVPFKVGDAYFIRTVTYFATGRQKTMMGWETHITLCLPDTYLYKTPRYKTFWMALKFAVKAILY